MNVSKTEGALEAVGVWAPPFSYVFSVGVSPLIQKAVQEKRIWSLKAPRLCGSQFFCRSQPFWSRIAFWICGRINSMTDQTDSFKNNNDSKCITNVKISTSKSTSISTLCGSNWKLSCMKFFNFSAHRFKSKEPACTACREKAPNKCWMNWIDFLQVLHSVLN